MSCCCLCWGSSHCISRRPPEAWRPPEACAWRPFEAWWAWVATSNHDEWVWDGDIPRTPIGAHWCVEQPWQEGAQLASQVVHQGFDTGCHYCFEPCALWWIPCQHGLYEPSVWESWSHCGWPVHVWCLAEKTSTWWAKGPNCTWVESSLQISTQHPWTCWWQCGFT